MQRYKIFHSTSYRYSNSVQLGAHTLRLRPIEDHELRIESFSLNISPAPTLLWQRDVEGNSVATGTFQSNAQELVVECEMIIQQYNENPLNFLVADYAVDYPFAYTHDDRVLLNPYMEISDHQTKSIVTQWITNFFQVNEKIQTYTLLQRLASHIYGTLIYRIREEPGVQSAMQTIQSGTGSCRDFAQLFMEAAKCLGMASRFVSGYLYAPLNAGQQGHTHAWVEVYLPGAGWRRFDPTVGQMAGTDHIAVAVARLAESVPPVSGSFIGSAVSNLQVNVSVTKLA